MLKGKLFLVNVLTRNFQTIRNLQEENNAENCCYATLSDGTTKLYPFKSYCYLLQQSLQNLVRRPGFEDKCEIWRSRIHD